MIDIIGLEIEKALQIVFEKTGAAPAVERTVPPRGVPCEKGVWRVVRADLARGCITAAFFPLPGEGDTLGALPLKPCQGE